MALASDKLRRIILAGASTIIDGDVVLVNGIEDTVNSDGVRMPQGFIAADTSVVNGPGLTVAALLSVGGVPYAPINPPEQQAGVTAFYIGPEQDMTAPGTVNVLPAALFPAGIKVAQFVVFWDYTQKDGTVTTGPTLQIGTDAGITNMAGSAANPAFTSQAVNTRITPAGQPSPLISNQDPTAHGVRVQITSGAVLGTATVCKARLVVQMQMGTY